MKKFRPPLSEAEHKELERLAKLDFTSFNETDVREEFVRPLMTLLGYRKNQDYSVSTEESFRLHRIFMRVGRQSINLDYITDVRKQYFWLVEAKNGNPSNRDAIPEGDLHQAYFYSLHPEVNCRLFAVTNGWLFNLYDRDNLDESLTPLLSIKHSELPANFLQLDAYLGATQIVAATKEKLLREIKAVLAAEISLERLAEFKDEIGSVVNTVRPQVLENFRRNAARLDEENAFTRKSLLERMRPFEVLESMFMDSRVVMEVNATGRALADKIYPSGIEGNHVLFFDKLFLNGLRPVRFWYFVNAVSFLVQLHLRGQKRVYYPYKGQHDADVADLLYDYLRSILTRFEDRPDIRLLTIYEGIMLQTLSRAAFLSLASRETIANSVEFGRFLLPEELVAWREPREGGTLSTIIHAATLRACGEFLRKYYDTRSRSMDFVRAKQHIANSISKAAQITATTQNQYVALRQELGMEWSLGEHTEGVFRAWDPLIAAVLNIISAWDGLAQSLPDDVKQRITQVISIGSAGEQGAFRDKFSVPVQALDDAERARRREEFFSPEFTSRHTEYRTF